MSEYKPRHGRYDSFPEEQDTGRVRNRRSGSLHALDNNLTATFDQVMETPFFGQITWIDVEDDKAMSTPETENRNRKTGSIPSKEAKMQPVHFKTKRRPLRIFFLCAVLFVAACLPFHSSTGKTSHQQETHIASHPMPEKWKKLWTSQKAINSDYIGQIVFDAGLLDLAIVQADDLYQEDGTIYEFYTQDGVRVSEPEGYSGNDVYIWSDWKTHRYDGYAEDGAVFLDYRNRQSDQNLILYGHHIARDFDTKGNKEFTPLDVLLEEENYERNKTLKLILDNEIREYEVVRVFTIDVREEDQIQILRTDFSYDLSGNEDPGFFQEYLSFAESSSPYSIEAGLTKEDSFLTLITCIQHQPQYRQVVLCKETRVENFDG